MNRICSLLCFLVFFCACDDPSLDQNNAEVFDTLEPVPDAVRLSSIEVAVNTPTNLVEDIQISYNDNNLIERIDFNGNQYKSYSFEYAANNRLIQMSQTNPVSIPFDISYPEDDIVILYTEANAQIEQRLSTDSQNRIDRVITTSVDAGGNSIQTEDLRYVFNPNFNVSRINSYNANGQLIAYSELDYEFNNNPFRDMNEVIRLMLFPDFVPYTRYLPLSRRDFNVNAGTSNLVREFTYNYSLLDNQFPESRAVNLTENGTTNSSFEFFNYR